MAQERITAPNGDESGNDDVFGTPTGGGQESLTAQAAEADSLLEEIDGLLETNAEEFVRAYVQKGGQ